jgi:LysM repeat protein
MRKLLYLFFFVCSANVAFATGDSLNYLIPQDTVLLDINYRGQKLFNHQLEKGQTLYSLSKFYGLTLEMLYDYNPSIKNKVVHPGIIIVVPIPNKSIMRSLKLGIDRKKIAPIYYQVKKGDTLYGIATRSFRVSVDTMMARNNLSSHTLILGQKLAVGWIKIAPIDKKWQFPAGPSGKMTIENSKNKSEFLSKGFKRKTYIQTGKAQWNDKDNFSLNGLYCLHTTAPKGSVIRIENTFTKNVTYAKVVGRVPLNYEKWVVIVASKDVAEALNAIDPQFFVKVEHFR